MGLSLYCNEISEKVGSYSNVQKIRHLLLCGLKYCMEMEYPDENIDYITSFLTVKDQVNYKNYSRKEEMKLAKLDLGGFSSFIFHSDSDGTLSSYEAKLFMETWELTQEYMDDYLKINREFYLNDIFTESIQSGETIHFC